MDEIINRNDVKEIALAIDREIRSLPVQNAQNLRAVRRKYFHQIMQKNSEFIFDLAREIFENYHHRWVSYDLIRNHKEAFQKIGEAELLEFGKDLNSWGTVDLFAGLLSGPAWKDGQIPDELIHQWACSKDRWWRRAALVSTIPLNRRSFGGSGDVPRTLDVCRLLAGDRDDMVVKAMSWALRELIPHDADAVRKFLDKHEDCLASRVKREVNNKLTTGLKNPKRKKD